MAKKKAQAELIAEAPAEPTAPAQTQTGSGGGSYQGLARKWRPQTFGDLIGQEEVAQSLANALRENRVVHGHLLTGPRGVGKTTSARILARALNCSTGPTAEPCGKCRHCIDIANGSDMDVLEIDAASNTGVDKMRELLAGTILAPFAARYKVYIIDEVHMLSTGAFNALLKTLEEPPQNVIFIFATTEFDKVPETVRSRCMVHTFRRLSSDDVTRRLTYVAHAEGIKLEESAEREIYGMIAQVAEGGMRDALVALDQLLAMTGGKPNLETAQRMLGLAGHAALANAAQWLAEGNGPELLNLVEDLVNRGRSLERFVKALLGYMHDVMLLQAGARPEMLSLTGEGLERARDLSRRIAQPQVFNIINQLLELEEKTKRSTQVRLLVEFAFLRIAVVKSVLPIKDIMDRLGALPAANAPGAMSQSAPAAPPVARMVAAPEPAAARPAAPVAPVKAPVAVPQSAPPRRSVMSGGMAASAFLDSASEGEEPDLSGMMVGEDATPETSAPPVMKAAPKVEAKPVSAFAAPTPGPREAPTPAPIGDHPLMGLSREELIETLAGQLPDSAQFLARYLRASAAMRADATRLWIQWPAGEKVASTTLGKTENKRAIERTLADICGRTMTLYSDFATGPSAAAPANAGTNALTGAPSGSAPARAASSFAPATPARPAAPNAPRASSAPAFADSGYEYSDSDFVSADDPNIQRVLAAQARQSKRDASGPPSLAEGVTAQGTRSLLESDGEFARRAKMVRDFFSGTFVDGAGNPVGI